MITKLRTTKRLLSKLKSAVIFLGLKICNRLRKKLQN